VTVKERLTSSGTETDSLIRRHPKILFVPFEHLARELFKPLSYRDGHATFVRRSLRTGLQFSRISSHKQVSSFQSGYPATLLLTTNRKNWDNWLTGRQRSPWKVLGLQPV